MRAAKDLTKDGPGRVDKTRTSTAVQSEGGRDNTSHAGTRESIS